MARKRHKAEEIVAIRRQVEVLTAQGRSVAEAVFSMRNLPLLEQGTSYDPLATAENLCAAVKVYASGGENAFHAHGGEDHAFIVLQGKEYEGTTLREHLGLPKPENRFTRAL